jgi:hypothetical protein
MRDLSELGMFDNCRDPRPSVTPELIAKFEEDFGVRLPDDYITFLRFSNGGCPDLDYSQDYSIDSFYEMTGDGVDRDKMWSSKRQLNWLLPGKDIPIARDGMGGIFFIDCARDPAPVLFISLDNTNDVVSIADSFGEFIDQLGPNRYEEK